MSVTLYLAAISIVLGAAMPAAPPGPPDTSAGLEALREGRFREAQELLGRLAKQHAASPEGPLLEGLVTWWRLLEHEDDPDLRRLMEERLQEATRRGTALAAGDDSATRERGLTQAGIAQLLEAQSRAARKAHFGAASLARQGHRALSEALALRPDSPDALFAMGAYDYYAANLPLLVRGLRFLFFIPGGDEARGIERLERAGAAGGTFGTESLMLLSHIFSGGYEDDMPRALAYLEQAAGRHPRSPLIALARADLRYRLGNLREASSLAAWAIERVRARHGFAPEIASFAVYRQAACSLVLRDPLAALDLIESFLAPGSPQAGPEPRRWAGLAASAATEAGLPERGLTLLSRLPLPDEEERRLRDRLSKALDPASSTRAAALAEAAAGHADDASRRLEALARQRPDDARVRYDLGRLLQIQGRYEEARRHLEAAARSADSPEVTGWSLIRLGWGLEREGRRGEAISLYRRAAQVKRFTFQAAARDLAARPASRAPEG